MEEPVVRSAAEEEQQLVANSTHAGHVIRNVSNVIPSQWDHEEGKSEYQFHIITSVPVRAVVCMAVALRNAILHEDMR